MIDLTAFQQHCLLVIATCERQDGEVPHGLAVKSGLEALYGEGINHGRLYPNLDTLVDDGYVVKSERDKRTNEYGLTDRGLEAISTHERFIRHAQGEDVSNPYTTSEQAPTPADD